jgi:hypothetical protein
MGKSPMKKQIRLAVAALSLTTLLARSADAPPVFSGTAVETMDSGGYTYVLIDGGTQKMWAASFPVAVKTGEKVVVASGYEMQDFQSPTLNRKFDRILFVSSMQVGTNNNATAGLPAGHPDVKNAVPAAAPVDGIKGTVVETMNAGSYTYVKVESSNETVWAAANRFLVAKGDTVTVPRGQIMKDFSSPTLKRTFKEIYFVGHIEVQGAAEKTSGIKWTPTDVPSTALTAATKITPPAGGKSISEINAQRKKLAGQDVIVKGRVTKFVSGVLDRNWIHIVDGSGSDPAADLTVTTADTAAVGDVVTARGKVAIDQNFGSGYAYSVLVEKASVTKE